MPKLAKLEADLSSVSVSCKGAAAPAELVLNMGILGMTIIVIESDFQLYSVISHNQIVGLNLSVVLASGYRDAFLKRIEVRAADQRDPFYYCLYAMLMSFQVV